MIRNKILFQITANKTSRDETNAVEKSPEYEKSPQQQKRIQISNDAIAGAQIQNMAKRK